MKLKKIALGLDMGRFDRCLDIVWWGLLVFAVGFAAWAAGHPPAAVEVRRVGYPWQYIPLVVPTNFPSN